MKINWSKEIREIIESSHCRYCGRLSEKHGDKCRWDVDVAVEEVESLLSKQLEELVEKCCIKCKKMVELENDKERGGN